MSQEGQVVFAGGEVSPPETRDFRSIPIAEVLDQWSAKIGQYTPERFVPPADTEGRSVEAVITEKLTELTTAWKRWPADGPTQRNDAITIAQGSAGSGIHMLHQDLCHTLGESLAENGTYMFLLPPPEALTDITKCLYWLNKQLSQYGLTTMDDGYFEPKYLHRFREPERWQNTSLAGRNEVEKAEKAIADQSKWDRQFQQRYSSQKNWVFNEEHYETEIIDRLFFHHIEGLNKTRREKRMGPPISLILLSDNSGHLFPVGINRTEPSNVRDNIENLYITQPALYRDDHRIHQVVGLNCMNEYSHSPSSDVYANTLQIADFTAVQATQQLIAIAQACNPHMDADAVEREAAKFAHQFSGYSWGNPHLNSLLCGVATWRNATHTPLVQSDIDAAICRVMRCDVGFLDIFRQMITKCEQPWNAEVMKPFMIESGYPESFVYEFRDALYYRGIIERGKNPWAFYNVRNCFMEAANLRVNE